MTPRSKKAKPSFDVARAPLDSGAAGWVYRSDPPPDPVTSVTPMKPEATPAVRSAAGRFESGLDLLLTPFTLSLMVMFVKMRWIIGPRSGDSR